MAAGLPVIADPWGGALDRVTPQTGWLLDKAGQVEVLKTVTVEELRAKGQAARERARTEFVSERWVDLLVPAS
jgi:hypothetical protein